ncbi:hypothetical protein C823_000152 [Eubacterium plexicaudatum ASF492]|nr:hypothetical protein C823_000152 [Eubacterium plexicaudatum ASF492]
MVVWVRSHMCFVHFANSEKNAEGRYACETDTGRSYMPMPGFDWYCILLLCTFSSAGTFTDENDNIRGGMIIANGGVLYKDYITQHTPVAYYICALFALLGAGSVRQFRLSYYLFVAVLWGLLYVRHASHFGKRKMYLLAIAESVFIPAVVPLQGAQVLSDGIQGMCMVVLMLEFFSFYQDRKLGWDRMWIVSACVWGSFGSAFVSAYALIWVIGIVLILEFLYWKNKKFLSVSFIFDITDLLFPYRCHYYAESFIWQRMERCGKHISRHINLIRKYMHVIYRVLAPILCSH